MLAETIVDPKTLVAFNLKKGSLPIRGDVDLAAANDCMKKGLAILGKGIVLVSTDQLLSADTQKQKERPVLAFFANSSMTPKPHKSAFAEFSKRLTEAVILTSQSLDLSSTLGLSRGSASQDHVIDVVCVIGRRQMLGTGPSMTKESLGVVINFLGCEKRRLL